MTKIAIAFLYNEACALEERHAIKKGGDGVEKTMETDWNLYGFVFTECTGMQTSDRRVLSADPGVYSGAVPQRKRQKACNTAFIVCPFFTASDGRCREVWRDRYLYYLWYEAV